MLTHLGPPVLQTSDIRKLCEVPGAVPAAPTAPSAGHRPHVSWRRAGKRRLALYPPSMREALGAVEKRYEETVRRKEALSADLARSREQATYLRAQLDALRSEPKEDVPDKALEDLQARFAAAVEIQVRADQELTRLHELLRGLDQQRDTIRTSTQLEVWDVPELQLTGRLSLLERRREEIDQQLSSLNEARQRTQVNEPADAGLESE